MSDTKSIAAFKIEARRAFAASLQKPAKTTRGIQCEPSGDAAAVVGFERSVPRCETCVLAKRSKIVLHAHTKRLPVVIVPPVCTRGNFYTRDTAVCDHWTGQGGQTLEAMTP
jgi:hypothetical protein